MSDDPNARDEPSELHAGDERFEELLYEIEREIERDDPDDDRTLFERFPSEQRSRLALVLLEQSKRTQDESLRPYVDEAQHYANEAALADLADEVMRRDGKLSGRQGRNRDSLLEYARSVADGRPAGHAGRLRQNLAAGWMTHTEVCVRLASYLIREQLVTSDVHVALAGREITRNDNIVFHCGRYFHDHGGTHDGAPPGAYARYAIAGSSYGVILVPDTGKGSVIAGIGPGSRLIVHAWPGPTAARRPGQTLHALRGALAMALIRPDVREDDLLAVALPRSKRMNAIADAIRQIPRVAATGISILVVDSVGGVSGYPLPPRYEPPSFETLTD